MPTEPFPLRHISSKSIFVNQTISQKGAESFIDLAVIASLPSPLRTCGITQQALTDHVVSLTIPLHHEYVSVAELLEANHAETAFRAKVLWFMCQTHFLCLNYCPDTITKSLMLTLSKCFKQLSCSYLQFLCSNHWKSLLFKLLKIACLWQWIWNSHDIIKLRSVPAPSNRPRQKWQATSLRIPPLAGILAKWVHLSQKHKGEAHLFL